MNIFHRETSHVRQSQIQALQRVHSPSNQFPARMENPIPGSRFLELGERRLDFLMNRKLMSLYIQGGCLGLRTCAVWLHFASFRVKFYFGSLGFPGKFLSWESLNFVSKIFLLLAEVHLLNSNLKWYFKYFNRIFSR